MAIRGGYVLKELGYGIRRNVTLFIASIITVTISLTQFGFGLIVSEAVQSATERWQGDIEFIVFMNPEATQEQDAAVRAMVDSGSNPEIRAYEYVDKDAAYAEFQELFKDSPELIENVTPELLPPSYRVVPVDSDADVITAIADRFRNQPGVRRVVLATEVIRQLQSTTNQIAFILVSISAVLLVAAALLVFNTIRTVIFARRREIEVMKLVGASNWYIRFPFMIEGTLQGVLGGVLAIPLLFLLRNLIGGIARGDDEDITLTLLQGFEVDQSTVWYLGGLVVAVGALIGALASLIAITRFLDV